MAKVKHIPNTQQFLSETIKHLNRALEILSTENSTHLAVDTYVGLAASSAVTVNYYDNQSLPDGVLAKLQALAKSKKANQYDMARELKYNNEPVAEPNRGVYNAWKAVAKRFDYEALRNELTASIREVLSEIAPAMDTNQKFNTQTVSQETLEEAIARVLGLQVNDATTVYVIGKKTLISPYWDIEVNAISFGHAKEIIKRRREGGNSSLMISDTVCFSRKRAEAEKLYILEGFLEEWSESHSPFVSSYWTHDETRGEILEYAVNFRVRNQEAPKWWQECGYSAVETKEDENGEHYWIPVKNED